MFPLLGCAAAKAGMKMGSPLGVWLTSIIMG
jgi:hypothetical protein